MNDARYLNYLVSTLLIVASCTAVAAGDLALNINDLINSGKLMDIKSVVLKTSHPSDADICKGFSLNEGQIRSFFQRADQVPSEGFYEYYDSAPCEVQGSFLYEKKTYLFDINAGNTGTIKLSADKYVYFACEKKCRDIFDYGLGTSGDE